MMAPLRYSFLIIVFFSPLTTWACQKPQTILEPIPEEPEYQEVIANIDEKNERGETALIRAAGSGDYEMTKLLLQYNADPNTQDRLGRTPLMWAAIGNFPAIIELLLANQAAVNAVDSNGKSALMYATMWLDGKCLETLLTQRADHTLQDNNGQVALMHAIELEAHDNVDLLLDQKPFLAADRFGVTIHDYIKKYTNQQKRKEEQALLAQKTKQAQETKIAYENIDLSGISLTTKMRRKPTRKL